MTEIGASAQADKIIRSSTVGSEAGWKADGNSPVAVSGVSSYKYVVADEYDQYFITFEPEAGTNSINLDMQINGLTGTDYNYVDYSGSKTSGDTVFSTVAYTATGSRRTFAMMCSGRWSGNFNVGNLISDGGTNRFNVGDHTNSTGPLDSFTFLEQNGYSFDLVLNVYGRDLER